MNVRIRLSMTTELCQKWGRGGGNGRLVSGTFSGRRGTRIRGGYIMSIELDLVRVLNELMDALDR